MSKVYIFLTDKFEEIEGLTVVDLLRRANIDIDMVSITGRVEVTGSHLIQVKADVLFDDTNFDDGDMLVLPGGPGTPDLINHKGLDQLIHKYHQNGKALAAICAAPSVLGTKGILAGKNAVCYPGFEVKLEGANIVNKKVVQDGNIITSKGMGTATDFALSIIQYLVGSEKAKEIADSIQFDGWN